MNYLEKYKKYKTKYLNLLKKMNQKGGAVEITFDLDRYKDLYKKFIFELNYEMAFSLDYDPNDGKLISEFIKGKPFVTEEGADYKMKLFNERIYFTHINCHTHDHFSAKSEGYIFAPPSPSDFNVIIDNFCKYNTYLNLVFTPEGIYEISLSQDLIDKLNNQPLALMRWHHAPTSRRYNSTRTYPEWKTFKEQFLYRINDIHILTIKPDKISHDIYEERRDYYFETYGVYINTIDDYLEEIRKVGFNINLYKWEDPLIIKLIIPTNVHKFLDATIKAKRGGFLLDILLINGDTFEEKDDNDEDNEYLTKDLNNNRYVDLNLDLLNNSIDDIYAIAVRDE